MINCYERVVKAVLKDIYLVFSFPEVQNFKSNSCYLQVNLVTAWIDGSSIYGPSTSWSDSLRSFSGGLLTSGSEWNMPLEEKGHSQMWSAADPATCAHGPHGLYGETYFIL